MTLLRSRKERSARCSNACSRFTGLFRTRSRSRATNSRTASDRVLLSALGCIPSARGSVLYSDEISSVRRWRRACESWKSICSCSFRFCSRKNAFCSRSRVVCQTRTRSVPTATIPPPASATVPGESSLQSNALTAASRRVSPKGHWARFKYLGSMRKRLWSCSMSWASKACKSSRLITPWASTDFWLPSFSCDIVISSAGGRVSSRVDHCTEPL